MKKLNFTDEQMNLFFKLVNEGKSRYKISQVLHCDGDTIRRLGREHNIKYLQEHYTFSERQKSEIRYLYMNTDMSVYDIGSKLKLRDVDGFIMENFTEEERDAHHRRLLRNQKLGEKNPMKKTTGTKHPNYIGLVDDGNGYDMIQKPSWYTGRKGSDYVFLHTIVMCEFLGLTELPPNCNIHHIDGNKKNNNINNLALMHSSGHTRLHSILKIYNLK